MSLMIGSICKNCKCVFKVRESEIKRGFGLFCSKNCYKVYRKKEFLIIKADRERIHNFVCDYCKKSFYKDIKERKNSRKGFTFCSRKCKDLAQRISSGEKFKELRPPMYGEKDSGMYRDRALEEYGCFCKVCGYDILEILEVHYIDGNRNNNSIVNLIVLCPTHHKEIQYGIRNINGAML